MLLDPEMTHILEQLGRSPYVDLAALPAAEAMAIARPPVPDLGPVAAGLRVGNATVRVTGGSVALRWYAPESAVLLPMAVHLHGGGWVTGSIEQEDARCQFMAIGSGCVIVSVGYRLSPEHRFPLPVEDCVAAWDWAQANAAAIGGDAGRVAVSGSSAGGHLAAALLLILKARGGLMPRFQLQTYPALDPSLAHPSCAEFADGPFMTRTRMAWYWDQYLGDGTDRSDPLLSILDADLSGLPPALVQVAEYDVLRDEGVAYARRLHEAGVAAVVRCHERMIHGFIAIAPGHPESTLALAEGCAALRTHLQ